MNVTPGQVESPARTPQEREECLRAAIRGAGTCTFRWDAATGALEWDENLPRVLGLPTAEAPCTLERLLELVHPDERAAVAEGWRRCAERGVEIDVEFRLQSGRAGEDRWLCGKGAARVESDGRLLVLGGCVDVTRHRSAARERAARARSDFTGILSHELRTPLTAVIGYAELLEMGIPEPIGPEAQLQVERIHLSALRLQRLIDDLLAFSRLDREREPVDPDVVPLPALLREVAGRVEPLAAQRGLAFRVDVDRAPATLRTDPHKVRRILLNLLGNAVKFTGSGAVELHASAAGDGARFQVRDTGRGMDAEQLQRAFDPFWQADSLYTRSAGGTGLGLSIARRLVEALGGHVAVESEVGRGTVVTVEIPPCEGPTSA